MTGKLYESEFELAVLEYLSNEGWIYTPGDELNRKLTDTLYEDDLIEYLKARYVSAGVLPEEDIPAVVARLRNTSGVSDYHSFCAAVRLYQDGYTCKPSNELPAFDLEYIDFSNPSGNIFRVVNQFEIVQGQERRIPDVLLFVNGIPVCIMELKNPTDENATIRTAHTQITVRYRRDLPELLKFCALACISDGAQTRLGTITAPFEFFYAWKKVENED
ncbi:type I restriction endonuclease, partial [Mailhella sp.]